MHTHQAKPHASGAEVQALDFGYVRSPDQDRTTPAQHPVVVIGAGPVGLSLAIGMLIDDAIVGFRKAEEMAKQMEEMKKKEEEQNRIERERLLELEKQAEAAAAGGAPAETPPAGG